MELNEHVNLQNASDFLTNEIKEISENWTRTKLGLIALDKNILGAFVPTKEEEETHAEVESALKEKNDKKKEYFLKTLSEDKKKAYDRVESHKNKIKSVANMTDNLKQYEDFLEVANEFKKEIDGQLKN
jgi:hypothetical protein